MIQFVKIKVYKHVEMKNEVKKSSRTLMVIFTSVKLKMIYQSKR